MGDVATVPYDGDECGCGWQARYLDKAVDLQHAEQQIRVMRRMIARLQKELDGDEAADPRFNDAKEVFGHWAAAIHPGSDRVVFGPKRRKAVLARLKEGHTVEDLKRAIDGYAADAYIGENGVRYDDLELICRDEAQVAKGIKRADAADRRQGIRRTPKLIEKLTQAGASPIHDQHHDHFRARCVVCREYWDDPYYRPLVVDGDALNCRCDVCGAGVTAVVLALTTPKRET